MNKTPTTLKWLAETRARHAYDLERIERIAVDIMARLEGLRADMAALDHSIRLYDPTINPAAIESVQGTKGRYGKHGALAEAIKDILRAHAPHWLSTVNLEMLVRCRLQIAFESPQERRHWYRGSFANLLRKFVVAGIVERQQDPDIPTNEVGRWRWKGEVEAPTLAELGTHSRAQNEPASASCAIEKGKP
jgi:hypothetical protein